MEYYNPNPWVRILGRANVTEIEINGKINKALIDSGAMISMMSKGYCDEQGYDIQSLDRLVPIEGSGGTDVLYLVYVEVRCIFQESALLIRMFSCSSVTPLLIIIEGYQYR